MLDVGRSMFDVHQGGPPCPPKAVGTVADPTIAQHPSFFLD